MRPPDRDSVPPAGPAVTANERLKRGSRTRFHWSVVGSVLVHAAVIVGWPAFDTPVLEAGPSGGGGFDLVALGLVPTLPGISTAFEAVPEAEEQTEEEEGRAEEDEDEGLEDGATLAGLQAAWHAYGSPEATLARLNRLRPEVVSAAPEEDSVLAEEEPGAAGESSDNGLRIDGTGSDLVYEALSEEEMLELERLSALRPELAILSPNQWLVVRNPSEVGDFMRRRFGLPEQDEGPRGYLSVSVWIDERGSVEWAEINRSSGSPEIDASALDLFRNVVAFRPARDGGLRVPVAAIFWLMW